ncbi:CoA-binding protein [Tsukamurella sputi]|uniref:CoA-binding protein n=1 Tax=Tsukamurella sputi TaxID=2591848 RepID=A0A5C5RQ71_9ACTN|nr:acetate--CoA ligase [Tsukamurella sputi]TWS24291.1 CoA-binding protein [Tsukamurella sputi]
MSTIVARDLGVLFDPASVAIVGASNDETKYGNWIGVEAIKMAGRRTVHLVNRRGEEVLGCATLRSVRDAGEPVDLVVIAVPVSGFEDAVEDALAAGARAIVGVTAGFAEIGDEGRAMQERVVARVREAGAVLVGPNCLGVSDSTAGLTLASNALPAGRVALLSQSGNMALETAQLLSARGHGFSRFVSLGNQADIELADLIRACADHDGTDLIAVYCEDFGDGRAFVEASRAAAEAGKPVVVLTVGGSEASVRGARSHTGAMTSSAAVVQAACDAAGVVRVGSPRALADAAALLMSCSRTPVRTVGILADGGGHAGVGSDVATRAGLEVPEFGSATADSLRAVLPPSAAVSNPVDLAGAGEQDITSFAVVLDAMLGDDAVDAVLATGYFGGYGMYGGALAAAEVATAHEMVRIIRERGKPVVVHTMHPDSPAAEVLRSSGILVVGAVDDGADALAVVGSAAAGRDVPRLPSESAAPVTTADYWNDRRLLAAAGVRFPAAALVTGADDAVANADEIGYPVVVKAMGLLHKSDSGGVALGLADAAAVRAAVDRMDRDLQPPAYVVEAMADLKAGVELIVGVQRDPRFGPVLMVGLGGVFTEVLGDTAFALAPVDADTARGLLESLRCAALLRGVRGRPAVDVAAAARLIATVSEVAVAHPEISELEVNPVLATADGALALDVRVVL